MLVILTDSESLTSFWVHWPATLCSMTLLQLHSWGQAFTDIVENSSQNALKIRNKQGD